METVILNVLKAFTGRRNTFVNVSWWTSATPYPMVLLFIYQIKTDLPLLSAFLQCLALVAFLMAGAFLGRLVNDRFDVDSDEMASKENLYLSSDKTRLDGLILLCTLVILFVWLPWSKNIFLSLSIGLLAPVLALVYSHKNIRCKEKGFLSVLIDSAYAFVLPSAMILVSLEIDSFIAIGGLLFLWLYGMPNMLYHHFLDLENDTKSGTQTFGRSYPAFSKTIIVAISTVVIAVMAVTLMYSTISLLEYRIPFFVFLVMLIVFEWSTFQRLSEPYLVFLHITWFTARHLFLLFFTCYTISEEAYLQVACTMIFYGHLFLPPIQALLKKSFYSIEAFVPKVRRFAFLTLSYLVNHTIYWIFRLFGVDLKVLNTSALGYLRSHLKGLKKRDA